MTTSPARGNAGNSTALKPAVPNVAQAGIQGRCRVHDLRHTYAANQVNGGVQLLELSNAMGHATVAFTLDVYGHLWDVSQDSVANRSDELLDKLDRWILQDQAQAAETAAG